jgi:hypothetical protein
MPSILQGVVPGRKKIPLSVNGKGVAARLSYNLLK